jgi:hypothetical protein
VIYTVTWTKAAVNELTNLWLNALDRSAVTRASARIEALLRSNPYAQSESRDGNKRVIFAPPLGVMFTVSDADRIVTVRAIWRT